MAFFKNEIMWEKFKDYYNVTEDDIPILQRKFQEHVVSLSIVILLAVLYGTVSIIAVVGNLLVIFVVILRQNMQTVTNIFLANLAFADVILGLFAIPFQFQSAILQRWEVADSMCRIAPFVKNVSINVSVLSLTLIAIDRYIAVLYPLRAGFHKKVAAAILTVIWIISIVASLPEALYFKVTSLFAVSDLEIRKVCNVIWPSPTFHIRYCVFLFLVQYIIPLSIITLSYIRVTRKIWGNGPPGIQLVERRDSTRCANKKKVVKMLIIVVSLFGLCWLPLQVYNILVPFYKDKITSFKYINIVWLCSNWLAMSNSCYNPFIYGLLNEKFKREFKHVISSCTFCCKRKQRMCNGMQTYQFGGKQMKNGKTSVAFAPNDNSFEYRLCECSSIEMK